MLPPATVSLIPADHSASASWIDNAVLVYGPRKAGTTLFQNLLDGGDELLAYPAELKLKYFARKFRSTKTAATYFERSRIGSVSSPHLAVDTYADYWRRAGTDGRRWPVGELIRFDAWALAQSVDPGPRPSVWCAKEVGGGRHDILAYWRRLLGPKKALFVVREPFFVTSAVLRDRRKKNRRLSAGEIAREVIDVLRTLKRQLRYIDDPGVHFTVYEELVADPEREMRRVAAFLGIAWSPVLARPTLFGDPIVVRTASRKTTEIFRSDASWREGLTEREQRIVLAVTEYARRFTGLPVDYDALVKRISGRER